MLTWKLRVLMAEKGISGKELAKWSGLSEISVSRLRSTDTIKQIAAKTLNGLCTGLTLAYRARGEKKIITPGDLFEFEFKQNETNETNH